MLARIILGIIGLAVLLTLVVLAWPQAFGLEHVQGVAQLVAFRAALAAGAVVLAVLLLLGMLLARRLRRFLGFLTVVLLLFAGANAAVLASRGFSAGSGHAGSAPTAADGDIVVLSWNTYGGGTDARTIAALALRLGADVVTLPETTAETATAVAGLMATAGSPVVAQTATNGDYPGNATSILVSTALGEYAVNTSFGDTSTPPSLVVSPVNGEGPTLAAVHPVAPAPDELHNWQGDLQFIDRLCASPNTIVAGDFNATLDHLSGDAGCTDAALAGGTAAVGSWPTWLPPLVGTQIDHVLATSGWKVLSAEVIQTEDEAGSDHRPVTATLTRN
jgi:endonuclease/exonuclease/phosphatase (EEP) superfamily protein YafD